MTKFLRYYGNLIGVLSWVLGLWLGISAYATAAVYQYVFFSFDTITSGSGSFSTSVTSETFSGTPTITYAGSSLASSGGATTYTAYDGTTWLGSGGSSTPGHSLVWQNSSTGNSFTITLDTTGVQPFLIRMDIRSYTGGPTAFTDVVYNTGSGNISGTASGLSLNAITTGSSYVSWTLDLTPIASALSNQSSVTLQFIIPDITSSSTSFRVDNLEITAQAIPEPHGSILLGLLTLGIALMWKKCGKRFHACEWSKSSIKNAVGHRVSIGSF